MIWFEFEVDFLAMIGIDRNKGGEVLMSPPPKMASSLISMAPVSRPRHEVNSCCGLTQN